MLPGSLRLRLTMVSTAVVAVVLVITATGLWIGQRRVVSDNMTASLRLRADDAVARLGEPPSLVSIRGLSTADDDRGVQLVSANGAVIAASPNLVDLPALGIDLDPGETELVTERSGLGIDDDNYRILTRSIPGSDGTNADAPSILHVLQSTDDMEEALAALAAALAVGVPIVVLGLAALMWWLTGRTLRPVDVMRRQVDAITASDDGRRIELPARHDEVGRLAVTMNNLLDRLAAATDRQRQFVADAAHELRTPLTRIRTAAEIDLGRSDRDRSDDDVDTTRRLIVSESVELQHLIDDLLLLARADAGRLPMRQDPVDLDDIVLSECDQQRVTSPTVAVDTRAVSAAHLRGDAAQLTRMVRNLLTNATRHASSRVEVALRQAGSTIEFSVGDDGPGVPPDDRERIFDRFARVDEARSRSTGGAGLGLAIARDIVVRHQGSVVYDADRGPGACFVVRLPGQD